MVALKNEVKPYSEDTMRLYCKENMDKSQVEPIVRDAFDAGLVNPVSAFVYLRIAQMSEGDKTITCTGIAKEAGLSPGAITQYKKNPLIGISQKKFMQLLLKTHTKDLMGMCESRDFNQRLTDYMNKYRSMIVIHESDEIKQREEYELHREEPISKDVCRKIYKELVQSREKGWDSVKLDTVAVITVEISEEEDKIEVKFIQRGENREPLVLKCKGDKLVKDVTAKLGQIIGGLLSNYDSWECVYLLRPKNRKVSRCMECIAIGNERVYLL